MNSIIPKQEEFEAMWVWAERLVRSNMLPPSLNSPEKVLVVLEAGREYGLPPYVAINSFFPVPGQGGGVSLGIRATAALGLVMRQGLVEDYRIQETDTETIITIKRKGLATPISARFTARDAERAGLANKQNWRQYPRHMRFARALMDVLRRAFPDVLGGLYSPEELGVDDYADATEARNSILPMIEPRVEDAVERAEQIEETQSDETQEAAVAEEEPVIEVLEETVADEAAAIEVSKDTDKPKRRKLTKQEREWIIAAKMEMSGVSYEVAQALAASMSYEQAKRWHDEEYLPWKEAQKELNIEETSDETAE